MLRRHISKVLQLREKITLNFRFYRHILDRVLLEVVDLVLEVWLEVLIFVPYVFG